MTLIRVLFDTNVRLASIAVENSVNYLVTDNIKDFPGSDHAYTTLTPPDNLNRIKAVSSIALIISRRPSHKPWHNGGVFNLSRSLIVIHA